ncbi:MAG TPA: GIY-YIG nuclease family protein [Bryobacteraceae bacterium]|nr:GIY-YIG nuclease family protein [Bryobacteraceae bacterium]
MDSSRKAAIQSFKERKIARGIFAMRCRATGGVWVDSAMDLRAAENRAWSELRMAGAHLEKNIAAEFREHGQENFHFEILETLADDVAELSLHDVLKERKLYWKERLNARTLSPV